ncbi:hypothetical protein [Patulibacter sp. SYSU D01012]|uniref:hypothetical protein n=1 Tax=Patulibacter sp. SYSU D01012 TaxID=2817381 RepID=UPI001B30C931|nr:hypothetical protein [Patulibacter sp. SYSU D01012]
MSFDDDEPTRMSPRVPQPPAGGGPPAGTPREPHPPAGRPRDPATPVAAAAPAAAWPQEDPRLVVLEERLSSLRTALLAFAAVAVVALGLATWALLRDGGDSGSSGGTSTRALRERVSSLEDRLDGRATDGDVEKVAKQVDALEEQVKAQPATTTTPAPDTGDEQAVSGLQDDVQELQRQVQQLQQAAANAGDDGAAPDDGTTTTP